MTKIHFALVLIILMFFLNGYTTKPQTIDDYTLSEIQSIDGVEDLSGITYSEHSKTYWLVNNSPELLIELNSEGQVLRKLPFENIGDTEDIAWIEGNLFAVVGEDDNRVVLIRIEGRDEAVTVKNVVQSWTAPGTFEKNKGLESVAYDRASGKLFCASEKYPIRFFELHFEAGSLVGEEVYKNSFIHREVGDVSAMTFSEDQSVVLSDETNLAIFINAQHKETGRILFSSGYNGLSDRIEQAEGVLLRDGKLIVVSEPNQIYIFNKKNH